MENEKKKTRAWGIASLVTSIIGLILFLAPYIGLPLSIISIVFSSKQKKIEPSGTATAGLVMGIIGCVLNAIMLLFVIGLFAMMRK